MPVSALPESGWEISRNDVDPDGLFWTTGEGPSPLDDPVAKNITIQIEDVIYTVEVVPEPAGLGLIGLAMMVTTRRRR